MSIYSMKNNLSKASSANHHNAARACHYVKRLRELSGRTEQSILVQLIIEGVETNPKFAEYLDDLKESWKETCEAAEGAR